MPASIDRLTVALSDRYAIEREIGSGDMATVYIAEDLEHRRKVEVKVLRPELAEALGPERFLGEIEIAAQLQHPLPHRASANTIASTTALTTVRTFARSPVR